jgi:hypothetical protein
MKEIQFEEAVSIFKKGGTVYFWYGNDEFEIDIDSEMMTKIELKGDCDIANIGYEVTFKELIFGKWFTAQ